MIILSMKSNYKGGELIALATQSTFDPASPIRSIHLYKL